jgi:hypothetical protein
MGGSQVFRKSQAIQLLDDHNYVFQYFPDDWGFDELIERSRPTCFCLTFCGYRLFPLLGEYY